jgi:hypothetical protein
MDVTSLGILTFELKLSLREWGTVGTALVVDHRWLVIRPVPLRYLSLSVGCWKLAVWFSLTIFAREAVAELARSLGLDDTLVCLFAAFDSFSTRPTELIFGTLLTIWPFWRILPVAYNKLRVAASYQPAAIATAMNVLCMMSEQGYFGTLVWEWW